MARHQTEAVEGFWITAQIELLRLPVLIALKAKALSSKDVVDLVKVATYRELKSRGYSNTEMAVLLGSSEKTVKNWGRLSRDIQARTVATLPLTRLIRGLRERPMSDIEIAHCFPATTEYDMGSVAVRMLERMGLATSRGGNRGGYVLSDEARHLEPEAWATPLSQIEAAFSTSLAILLHLSAGPTPEDRLFEWAEAESRDLATVSAALDMLVDLGDVEEREEAGVSSYRLSRSLHRMVLRDPAAQWRVGFLYMVEHLRAFLEAATDPANEQPYAQGNVVVQLTSEGLRATSKKLAQWIAKETPIAEEEAKGAAGVRPFSILWALAPFGR